MTTWVRSSRCAAGACVEVTTVRVADTVTQVLVRDSKNPHREPLAFTQEEWDAFIAGVKGGEFDPDTLT